MIRKVVNLVSLVRENGLLGLYSKIKQWAWKSIEYTVLKRSISIYESKPVSDSIEFRRATQADTPWIVNAMTHLGEKADKIISQQFDGRDLTIIGVSHENDKQLCFSAFLSFDEFAFTLLKDSVLDSDLSIRRIWVPPTSRKQGIATLGLNYANFIASQIGSKNIWSFVKESNIPSVKLHKKHGYRKFGKIRILTRFGRRYSMVKKVEKKKWKVHPIPRKISKL